MKYKDRILRIMPDYQCFPLWIIGEGIVENIHPDELPLTESLKTSITEWQKKYDATLDLNDPRNSGFKNLHEEQLFDTEGKEIWRLLQLELSELYDVKYFSVKEGVLFS